MVCGGRSVPAGVAVVLHLGQRRSARLSQQWEDGQRAAGSLESFAWPRRTLRICSPAACTTWWWSCTPPRTENGISDISDAVWKGQPAKVIRLSLTEGEVVDMFTNDYRVGKGASQTETSWGWTVRLSYACATNYTVKVETP